MASFAGRVALRAAGRCRVPAQRILRGASSKVAAAASRQTLARSGSRRAFHGRSALRADDAAAAEAKDKVVINFGELGVTPNHQPTVAQLKPGVVQVHNKDTEPTRFFISGGFAMVEEGKCSITVAEAINVDDIDPELANAGVDRYQQEMDRAANDQEKAEAQIGHEVHSVLKQALEYFK